MNCPVLPILPLKSISPSRFSGMRSCPLREVWTAGRVAELLPGSPSRFVGLITHRLQEEAALGRIDDPLARFDALVADTEGDLAGDPLNSRWLPLSLSVAGFDEVRQRAVEKAISELRARHVGERTQEPSRRRRVGPEVRVIARDGLISGLIDRVSVEAGKIVIYDEKFAEIRGSVRGARDAKADYVTQLKMYAAMYAEDTEISEGRWPDELVLRPIYGPQLQVHYSREECISLLDEAVAVLAEVNLIINSNDPLVAQSKLAQPSSSTCSMCKYRPGCDLYASESLSGEEGWPLDLKGVVAEMEWKGNGTLSLSVECPAGLFRVRGIESCILPSDQYRPLKVGNDIAIYSLRKTQSQFTFETGKFTTFVTARREAA